MLPAAPALTVPAFGFAPHRLDSGSPSRTNQMSRRTPPSAVINPSARTIGRARPPREAAPSAAATIRRG